MIAECEQFVLQVCLSISDWADVGSISYWGSIDASLGHPKCHEGHIPRIGKMLMPCPRFEYTHPSLH